MKKVLILIFMLFTVFTFSQENDKNSNPASKELLAVMKEKGLQFITPEYEGKLGGEQDIDPYRVIFLTEKGEEVPLEEAMNVLSKGMATPVGLMDKSNELAGIILKNKNVLNFLETIEKPKKENIQPSKELLQVLKTKKLQIITPEDEKKYFKESKPIQPHLLVYFSENGDSISMNKAIILMQEINYEPLGLMNESHELVGFILK